MEAGQSNPTAEATTTTAASYLEALLDGSALGEGLDRATSFFSRALDGLKLRIRGGNASTCAEADAASAARMEELRMVAESASEAQCLATLHTDSLRGLTPVEVEARLETHGRNTLDEEKNNSWYMLLWAAIWHPFNVLLLILAIVNAATESYTSAAYLLIMVALSVITRFQQEMSSASKAIELKKLVETKVNVLRRPAMAATLGHRRSIIDFPLSTEHQQATKASSIRDDSMDLERATPSAAHDDVDNFGVETLVDIETIVPGDIVILRAGELFPGDCVILSAKDLFVSESALTGESIPVEKTVSWTGNAFSGPPIQLPRAGGGDDAESREESTAAPSNPAPTTGSILSLKNVAFMGTSVTSGQGTAVVVTTGKSTYMSMVTQAAGQRKPLNAFQKGVRNVSVLLITFMLVMVPLVVIINGSITKDWLQAVLFGISVAVGLTPEMLPMIVNANLSRGSVSLMKKNVIVKRLDAIQNLGAMDCLCTDKTGTLTQDKVSLMRYLDASLHTNFQVLAFGYLNSFHQTSMKNLLDRAILNEGSSMDDLQEFVTKCWTKTDEIPFDFTRRRMSVLLSAINPTVATLGIQDHVPEELALKIRGDASFAQPAPLLLVTKGAVEEVLQACKYVKIIPPDTYEYTVLPLTPRMREELLQHSSGMNDEGLRVLGVATKLLPSNQQELRVADEADLTFQGFLAFVDPPKADAAEAIKLLHGNGVDVKVLTGDNVGVTRKICRDVGIDESVVVSGDALEAIDEELHKVLALAEGAPASAETKEIIEQAKKTAVQRWRDTVASGSVFAKLSPLQKMKVVMVLKEMGRVVGFLGDGINDAPALRCSDVGISVDSGTNVAKEAADIILLEKDLLVLDHGVIKGRETYGNTVKYIKMTASSNFGNVFSVLIAAAWLPFLPMAPLQILTQNLLYDIAQVALPFDHVDSDFVTKPRKWKAKGIARFMLWFGPTSSIFDIAIFAVMWFYFGWNGRGVTDPNQFQTGWFLEGFMTQSLVVHNLRTDKIPIIQSIASAPVLTMSLGMMIIANSLPYIPPIASFLGFLAPPPTYYGFLAAILVSYLMLVQVVKVAYKKRYQSFL